MSSCLFCDIAAGRIPSDTVYSDEDFVAFRDITPKTPTHILVIPRKHIPALTSLDGQDAGLMGDLIMRARDIADAEGLSPSGFRFVINCGDDGGQTVGHIHIHLLGGRALAWPPG